MRVTQHKATAILLGHTLLCASSDHPGISNGPFSVIPYSILLQVRFTVPIRHRTGPWALTPRFHPYVRPREAKRGLLSVALSLGSPPLDVIQHPVLWSPDFPPDVSPATVRFTASKSFLYPTRRLDGIGDVYFGLGFRCFIGGFFLRYLDGLIKDTCAIRTLFHCISTQHHLKLPGGNTEIASMAGTLS